MFEKYTEKARRVIFFARYEASMFGASAIEAEHVLLGLLREDAELFRRFGPAGLSVEGLRERFGGGASRDRIATSVELPLSQDSKRVLAHAHEESERLGHWHIGTEHLLLGLLLMGRTPAAQFLRENGFEAARVREALAADAGDVTDAASDDAAAMKIEHIGIATPSIEDALKFWRDALGLEVTHTETVEEQGVRVAMLPVGEPRVELLEPTHEGSPVAKFLEKRGPGIHHVAVRVKDIRASLARLKERGARLVDESPRVGAGGCLVAFVHPASAGGVLLELVEHTSNTFKLETERH